MVDDLFCTFHSPRFPNKIWLPRYVVAGTVVAIKHIGCWSQAGGGLTGRWSHYLHAAGRPAFQGVRYLTVYQLNSIKMDGWLLLLFSSG